MLIKFLIDVVIFILRAFEIKKTLLLSYENNSAAGYMLTGNHSIFLEDEGVICFLYPCPKKIWIYSVSEPVFFMTHNYKLFSFI